MPVEAKEFLRQYQEVIYNMISDCILSDPKGCKGLTEKHPYCGSSLCPFYKTVAMERRSQEKCQKRAEKTKYVFEPCYDVGVK